MPEPRDAEQSVLIDVEAVPAGTARVKPPVDKTFRRYDQDQPMLLPPDIRDWLPADHPARWVNDLVEDGLDLSLIYADYTEVRGAPPFDPRLMLKILIYGYSHGITSSRALERRCHDDVAFGFLTAQQAPDFVAISRFRTRHAEAFAQLFTQSLALCAQAGLVSLGRVALDGTKVRASASRHRAMSYDRMVRAEGELAAEVVALLADAERLDAAEDAAYGPDRRGDQLPAELARREGRLVAIRTAKATLEAEHAAKARALAEQTATERGQDPTQVLEAGDAAEAAAVVPAKAQRSFTDPDARIMKTSDGSFHYCFNAQTIVDEHSQVVLTSVLRRTFGSHNGADALCGPGANYLHVTDRAASAGDLVAATASTALLAVFTGDAPTARIDYPCHAPDEQRWFRLLIKMMPSQHEVLVVHDNITDYLQEVDRLQEQATHDRLTGLANRVALDARTAPDHPDRRQPGASLAIMMIGLDQFKDINDTWGHLAGDIVLEVVARRLQSLLRTGDMACRWGGDEFVLLLHTWHPAAVAVLARRIDAAISKPIDIGAARVQISASLATTTIEPRERFQDGLQRVDHTLGQRKQTRRTLNRPGAVVVVVPHAAD